jgi:hypothetical protein
MTTILAAFPGTEDIIKRIESNKWFNFTKLPIDNVPMDEVVGAIGIIPYLQVQTEYMWEATIALWCNRIHEYLKNPYELKAGFQLTDLGDLGKPMEEQRIEKNEYDLWLPVYEYVKNKINQ